MPTADSPPANAVPASYETVFAEAKALDPSGGPAAIKAVLTAAAAAALSPVEIAMVLDVMAERGLSANPLEAGCRWLVLELHRHPLA